MSLFGEIKAFLGFLVIDVDAAYNVLLGRIWCIKLQPFHLPIINL